MGNITNCRWNNCCHYWAILIRYIDWERYQVRLVNLFIWWFIVWCGWLREKCIYLVLCKIRQMCNEVWSVVHFFVAGDEIKSYSMVLQVVVCVQITVGTVTYILDGMRRGSFLQFKFISDNVSGKRLVIFLREITLSVQHMFWEYWSFKMYFYRKIPFQRREKVRNPPKHYPKHNFNKANFLGRSSFLTNFLSTSYVKLFSVCLFFLSIKFYWFWFLILLIWRVLPNI